MASCLSPQIGKTFATEGSGRYNSLVGLEIDQSKKEGIPKALSDTVADNEPNPLSKFHMNIKGKGREGEEVSINRDTIRRPRSPTEISSRKQVLKLNQQDIPQLYNVGDFRQFSERLRIGWHNFIHTWIGGDMGSVQTAAL